MLHTLLMLLPPLLRISLEPASMASARQLVLTPFAQLSYWMRYSADASPYTVLGHVRVRLSIPHIVMLLLKGREP